MEDWQVTLNYEINKKTINLKESEPEGRVYFSSYILSVGL